MSLPAYAAAQGMDVGTIGQILHVHAARDKIKLQIGALASYDTVLVITVQ